MKTILLVFLSLTIFLAKAHKPDKVMNDLSGWHAFGEKTVDFTCGREQIAVIGSPRFDWIKFKTDISLEITSIEIYFNDDQVQQVTLLPQKKGDDTKPILLNPGEHSIKKIAFEYTPSDKKSFSKAHIVVWGFLTPDGNEIAKK